MSKPEKTMEPRISKLQNLSIAAARPLPVILLCDVSGSMSEGGKIQALNNACGEMIAAFGEEDRSQAEIQVAVITFGQGGAQLQQPLRPAHGLRWPSLPADGNTPLGAALALCRQMVEDPQQVPSRAYRPCLVLVSDGQPNDEWEGPLQALHASPRAQKAQRFAMAIGDDADEEVLRRFLGGEGRVFRAKDARQMRQFFQWVTMTVTARSRSRAPDQLLALPPPALPPQDFGDDDAY